ncbi:MAG: DUF4290 domain-containing protein [Bacteroidia bacterium]|nr:DUF4290 domain-containing protein [Bacteroidia bacterium]
MDYNTTRRKLILPEYGRNIQKMVEYVTYVPDREERNKLVRAIVQVLSNLYPNYKETYDFKKKLWDHIALISDFKLDVDYPHDPKKAAELYKKPNRISYPNNSISYRHYGSIIEKMIEKAITFEEGEEKDALIQLIANHMKKQYLSWNRGSVSDDIIFSDLKELSKGKIDLLNKFKLLETREIISRTTKRNVKSSRPVKRIKRQIRRKY